MPFDYGSLFQGYQLPPYPTSGDPYGSYGIDLSQSNPAYAMKQNRGYFAGWGQGMGQQLTAQEQMAQEQMGMYGQAANMEGSNILNTPGWTSTEQGQIVDPSAYGRGMTSQAGFDSLNPTASEAAGITGDPSSYMNFFRDTPAQLAQNEQAGSSMAGDAITGAQMQAGGAMAQEGATINDIYGRASLSPSSNYYSDMNAAVDPSKLSLNLNPNYQMSNQEVQGMESQAAETVAGSEATRQQQIQQRMQAAGTSDPLAYAALSRETQGQTAEESANAVNSAQIQAEDAQRATEMNYAQANLSANQAYSGLKLGETQQAEQTALGAEQFKATGQMSASENLAGQGVSQAQWAGGQGTQTSEQFSQMYQQALQYAASTGTSIQEAMDQVSSGRASQLYGARQQNTMYGQQQGFQQNYETQAQLSQLYAQAAQARMQGQQAGLGWATGEQGMYGQMGMGLNQQQIGVGQTVFPNMNTATGQWGQYDLGKSQQSFGTQFMGAFGAGLGSIAGGRLLQPSSGGSGGSGGGGGWG